jgi:hypothetical protein
MASDRKITANRNNAKKSTGPRSVAGREAARRNARRHGLAVAIGGDPAFHEDIETLARVLALSTGTQIVDGVARDAAAAHIDLLRTRRMRAQLFRTLYGAVEMAPDRVAELNNQLAKLERYERRAFSRRNRLLRLV